MDQNARPRQTAPGIRSTISYIIFLDHVLGQGATSKVYLGRHKKSGKRVACKVPHPDYPYRGSADMERESKVLLHLKHPNILCLEAIETDQISKERILFMELCAAGSLYDMLEKPQHANGLQEEIFLQVFNDITCGMKYLRDKGLVHRDVKPGNIMCFTDEKGRTIYKLADFGAARELADEENFTSLYGTEEYLHPHMFQKAVLKEKSDQHFDARVDLWSIGITLYHLATGLLPFRPQGGRKNSPMMHYLTTEKAPGVISGVQTGPGRDDVIWSSELPETCQLSVGLKNLLTPLLASLLELDSMKVWSFTQFFEASQSILSRKVLHVLWVDRASNLRVYSNATDTFAVVQEAITAQTRLPAGKQVFFIDGDVYQADRKCTAADLPRTSRGKPIMLYSRGAAEASQISPPFVATMPVLHPRYSPQNDYPIAKGAVAAGYVLQRRQEQLHEMSDHFDRFVEVVRSNLLTDGLRLQADSASLMGKLEASALEIQLSSMALDALNRSREKNIAAKAQMLCHGLNQWKAVLGEHQQQCRDVAANLRSLLSELQRPDGLRALWKPSQGCSVNGDACTAELVHLISEMEEIFRRFAKDKKLGKLSYNEEQIHKMEKLNLGEKMKQMKACTVKCEQRWRNQHTLLMKWNDKASSQRQRIQVVHTTLATLMSRCQGLKRTIADLTSQSWRLIDSASGSPRDVSRDPAHLDQLENGTQTSLNLDRLHQQPSWGGIGHLTDSRQPLTMGPGKVDPSGVIMSPWQSQEPLPRSVASAPPTGAHYAAGLEQPSAVLRKSSPPVLDAHGYSSPTMIPDLPLELSGGPQRPSSEGDNRGASPPRGGAGARGGPRMIKLPKSLKHSLERYQKESGSTPYLIQESNKIMSAMDDLSLTVEMPDLDSIPVTLTQDVEGETPVDSDEEFGSLDIKRPPASYQSVVE